MKRYLCLLIVFGSMPAHTEWGRLFFSPQQRSDLNRAELHRAPPKATISTHQFTGEVHSGSGRSLRWVDGQLTSRKLPNGIKPGQSWDSQSGVIYPFGHDAPPK